MWRTILKNKNLRMHMGKTKAMVLGNERKEENEHEQMERFIYCGGIYELRRRPENKYNK